MAAAGAAAVNEPRTAYAGAAAWRKFDRDTEEAYVVCVHCVGLDPDWLEDVDPKARGWSALDDRTAGGRECKHCGRTLPRLATVALLPDGWSSVRVEPGSPMVPTGRGPGGDVVKTERRAEVLVRDGAVVRVAIWGGPEVVLRVAVGGALELLAFGPSHDGDSDPDAEWRWSPEVAPPT